MDASQHRGLNPWPSSWRPVCLLNTSHCCPRDFMIKPIKVKVMAVLIKMIKWRTPDNQYLKLTGHSYIFQTSKNGYLDVKLGIMWIVFILGLDLSITGYSPWVYIMHYCLIKLLSHSWWVLLLLFCTAVCSSVTLKPLNQHIPFIYAELFVDLGYVVILFIDTYFEALMCNNIHISIR